MPRRGVCCAESFVFVPFFLLFLMFLGVDRAWMHHIHRGREMNGEQLERAADYGC